MEKAAEMITTPQIRKIYYEIKQLGITNEQLHEMVEKEFNVDSLKKLTKGQGIFIIDILVKYTGNIKHRAGMATPMQLWKIEDLGKKLGWEPKGIKGFIKKYAHVEDARWLTDKAASGIIVGLTNIYKASENNSSCINN